MPTKKVDMAGVTDAMKSVATSDEALKPKRKNIDVIAEYSKRKPKKAANFVVIGKGTCRTRNNDRADPT